MIKLRNLTRLLGIQRVLIKHGLDEIILATHLFRPLRILRFGARWRASTASPRAVRIREALEELGPIYVKFGQAVSTRQDLLPPDIANELSKLQDSVPPFPGSQARQIIERAYKQSVDDVFGSFDETALAAASIAQVHGATLSDGRKVVVKVLRPDVERVIRRDLDVLYALADLAERYWREGRRLRPVEVVEEYEKTIIDELDLMREAANATQLRRNFEGSAMLYVPEVFWDYCRPNIMVLERISGIPVSDVAALKAHNTNIKRLAENGVEIFFTQVFEHNFFHADMHPGNIFIDVNDPENPRYIAVDFGIVGTLSPRDQHYLAENFLAFFKRDYYRVAKLHIDSGWVPAGTRIDELESAVRTVCEPIFDKPLKDISFGQLLLRLFSAARRFNMQVQPQLILLQKTLLSIEGLGRQIYPELDVWKTARPILERWVAERVSGRAIVEELRADWSDLNETLRQLPQLAGRFVQQAVDGELSIELRSPEVESLRDEMRQSNRRRYIAIGAGSLLISSAILIALDVTPWWLGWLGAATAVALFLVAIPKR